MCVLVDVWPKLFGHVENRVVRHLGSDSSFVARSRFRVFPISINVTATASVNFDGSPLLGSPVLWLAVRSFGNVRRETLQNEFAGEIRNSTCADACQTILYG